MPTGAALARARTAYTIIGAAIAAVLFVVLALVGLGVLWSLLIGVVLGAAAAWGIYVSADAIALKALGATPMPDGAYPRLENLLHGLTVANGFRDPALYVVDDAAPNAAAVGRTPRHSGLVVTTGLLDRLERVELEGVLAHELTRVRTRQTFLNVTAATLIGRPLGFAEGLAARLGGRLVGADAPVHTDLAGVGITRYPPGLTGALVSMRTDGRVVKTNPKAYRHLWLNVPEGPIVDLAFSLDDRIAVLQEL